MYELSFTEDFFTGTNYFEDIEITDKPTNILQAIISMYENDKENFEKMVQDVLGMSMPDYMTEEIAYSLLDNIREVNTCLNINNPVSVYVDSQGDYTLKIYE